MKTWLINIKNKIINFLTTSSNNRYEFTIPETPVGLITHWFNVTLSKQYSPIRLVLKLVNEDLSKNAFTYLFAEIDMLPGCPPSALLLTESWKSQLEILKTQLKLHFKW